MKIAKPGSWLAGYILGIGTVQTYRKKGWAIGKGEIKKVIHTWVSTSYLDFRTPSSAGFIDAILDSVN